MAKDKETKRGAPVGVDRLLAAEVRELALTKAKEVLVLGLAVKKRGHKETDDQKEERTHQNDLYQFVFRTVMGSSMPRLQEHSGPGGGPITTHDLTTAEKNKLTAILHGKEPKSESNGVDG